MNLFSELLNTNASLFFNSQNIVNTEQHMKSTYMGRLFFPIVTRLPEKILSFLNTFLNKIGCKSPQTWINAERTRRCQVHDKTVLVTHKEELSEEIERIKAVFERMQIIPLITKKEDGFSLDAGQKLGALKTLATEDESRKIFWSALNDQPFQKRLYDKIREGNSSFPEENTIKYIQKLAQGTFLNESVAAYILSRSSAFTEDVVKNSKNWFREHSLEVVLHDVVVENVNTFVKTAYIQSLLSPSDDQEVIHAFEHARKIGPAIKSMEAFATSLPSKKDKK